MRKPFQLLRTARKVSVSSMQKSRMSQGGVSAQYDLLSYKSTECPTGMLL